MKRTILRSFKVNYHGNILDVDHIKVGDGQNFQYRVNGIVDSFTWDADDFWNLMNENNAIIL